MEAAFKARRHSKKVFLFVFLCFIVGFPLISFAEEISSMPEVKLVRIGNALAAMDEISIPATEEEEFQAQAQALEREIELRKLGEKPAAEAGVPVQLAQPLPKMPELKASPAIPSLSAMAHESLFEDLDKEVIDPFRSGENFDNFMTRLWHFMDYNIGIYGEWDDNIFLTDALKVSDWKTIINQSIEIKYPMDKFYLEALYAVNFDIYAKMDELVDTQNASGRLSYYPFDHLTLGVADSVTKVGASKVATNFGDQTLNLGYMTNTLTADAQYELWKNGFFEFTWNFDHIDFNNKNIERFINRDVHSLDTRLKHRFTPVFSNYFGHRYKDVQFYDFRLKDSQSNILYYGADYQFPGWCTLYGEIGYEQKSFEHNDGQLVLTVDELEIVLPFDKRRNQDGNANYRFAIESNFSRFNTIGLSYDSKIVESSRPEFTQYLSKIFAINSRTFLDNKTILFKSFYLEHQEFDDDDAMSALFPSGGTETDIYATGITLRRILNDWLYFDVGYTHIFRDTDFIGENNKNNRVRFGARATF